MRNIFLFSLLSLSIIGCGSKNISIDIVVENGFQKKSQKLYQMVNAKDGWSGVWAGESVEVYVFENASSVQSDHFGSATAKGNISGWVEMCIHENILMLSKGKEACRLLENI